MPAKMEPRTSRLRSRSKPTRERSRVAVRNDEMAEGHLGSANLAVSIRRRLAEGVSPLCTLEYRGQASLRSQTTSQEIVRKSIKKGLRTGLPLLVITFLGIAHHG